MSRVRPILILAVLLALKKRGDSIALRIKRKSRALKARLRVK
jgi:hypothetical protein